MGPVGAGRLGGGTVGVVLQDLRGHVAQTATVGLKVVAIAFFSKTKIGNFQGQIVIRALQQQVLRLDIPEQLHARTTKTLPKHYKNITTRHTTNTHNKWGEGKEGIANRPSSPVHNVPVVASLDAL